MARLEEAHARRGAKAAPLPNADELGLDDGTARGAGLLEEEWKKAELFFRLWDAPGEGCCQPGRCVWARIQEEARARGLAIPDGGSGAGPDVLVLGAAPGRHPTAPGGNGGL